MYSNAQTTDIQPAGICKSTGVAYLSLIPPDSWRPPNFGPEIMVFLSKHSSTYKKAQWKSLKSALGNLACWHRDQVLTGET